MKQQENNKRDWLKENKPLAHEKLMKFIDNPKPIVQMQCSYKCNFVCNHCSIHKIQQQSFKAKKKELTIEQIKEVSRQADEYGIFRWEINGGEPLSFHNLEEIIQAIDPKKYYMNLVTNAWFLDREKVIWLKNQGIDRIQIGFDSLNEKEHDSFRNKEGAFKRCMDGAQFCKEEGLDVFITTVVTKERLYSEEFLKFIGYFNSWNVPVFTTYAKPVGEWEGHFENLVLPEDLEYSKKLEKEYNVFSHLTAAYERDRGCRAFRGLFAITPYGDVMPCQYIFVKLGNVLEEPLKDILERGLKLKSFKTPLCPIANDMNFINKYIVDKVYGKKLPVDYKEVFSSEDFE